MSDNYCGIMDFWPKAGEHFGLSIFLDTGGGEFVCKLEEEYFVSAETLTGVKKKIERFFTFKEKTKREKLTPIPVVHIETDKWDGGKLPTFEDVQVFALHAGNGNAIIKDSKGKKEQVSWSYSTFHKPMTEAERAEYVRLYIVYKTAEKAYSDYDEKFVIHQLKKYAREVWHLPKEE
jgi:hypothetical protein